MSDEKEQTGGEADAFEKGRTGSVDLDIFKSPSEEAAKERGEEAKIDADNTREENENAEAEKESDKD